jgi:4'-phosphopantetheinyl transferase
MDSLVPGELHVWFVRSDEVRDPGTLARYAAMMAPDERARHDRFRFEKDRHLFLVTRGTIRSLVAAYLGVDAASCAFETDRYGRPSLRRPWGTGFCFNLSHTPGAVACAIAPEPEIGVDVERVDRRISPDLPRRFFSAEEADALGALPEQAQAVRFYDYWTLKEAYIKARGLGLTLPLDGFTMLVEDAGPPRIRFAPSIPDDAASWQFAQFMPTPVHRLAVAARRHAADWRFSFREFIPAQS